MVAVCGVVYFAYFALRAQVPDEERRARLAAVYAIEHYGTQSHSYTREEFAERYKENFGEEPIIAEAFSIAT